MKNPCLKFKRQIENLVSGAAKPDRTKKLKEHIKQCPACSQYHQDLLADEQLLIGFCEAAASSVSHVEKGVIEQINLSNAMAPSISRVEKAVFEQINWDSAKTKLNLIERISKGRFSKMNRIMKIAAVILIVVGVGAVIGWLTQGQGFAGSAWAAVQEQVRNARTCTYTMITQVEDMPEVKARVMIIEPGLVRQEITEPHEQISIMDPRSGRTLALQVKQKKAMLIEISGLPEAAFAKFQEQNWMNRLKKLIEKSETELETKQINGRQAKGYQVHENDQVLTAWVDTETGKLLNMEIVVDRGGVKMVMCDFEFDKELNENLFSMKPPPGYTMAEKPMKIELNKEPAFEDVGVLLSVMAKMKDGQFPEALPEKPSMGAYMKHLKGFNRFIEEGEGPKVVMGMGRGIRFLAKIHPAGHYAGKGVKLGDADTAIFWYRPKGSEMYKVIFGDLSIKEVAETDLPR